MSTARNNKRLRIMKARQINRVGSAKLAYNLIFGQEENPYRITKKDNITLKPSDMKQGESIIAYIERVKKENE